MAWPVTSTRRVYENRWIAVDEDRVVAPDGSDGVYGVVTMRQPAVFVVAIDEADRVLLVDVDRHTVGRSLEVPAGGSDGEDPLVAARRELREETGLEAARWTRLGGMTALNGIARAPEHVFLARELSAPAGAATDAAEGIVGIRRAAVGEVLDLVRAGAVTDSETLGALLLALVALDRVR